MFQYLRQPYPLTYDAAYDIKVSFLTGSFVFFILFVFQPFGLSRIASPYKYYLIVGYSLVTLVTVLFNLLLIPRYLKKIFNEENWTIGRRILWQIWIVFTVGTACYLFACLFHILFDFYRLGPGLFLYLQLVTVLIAVIPIVVINILGQNYLLKKNLAASEAITAILKPPPSARMAPDPDRKVILTSDNEKEKFELVVGEILYISSEGNYAKVVMKQGHTGKIFIRSSLTRLEKQVIDFPFLLRCHRAYIVNIRKIRKVAGNAQGLQLTLDDCGKTIPVARSYAKEFRKRMETG